jgi:hypothetical protein
MRCRFNIRSVISLILLSSASFAFLGCAVVGPRSISMGRADYNAAINKTEDEQMLMAIVKGRYGETTSLLSVNGVAANVRFNTQAGVNFGFGPESNYSGNLVPFSGSGTYEENPTISYAPVNGEKYIRQLLSPIELDVLLLIMRAAETHEISYLSVLVKQINDLMNPDFINVSSAEPAQRFERFVALNRELHQAGVLYWVADQRKEVAFDIYISGYAPVYLGKVREYLTLLDLPMPANPSEEIVLPAYFAIKRRKGAGIAISTRSTGELVEILRAAVDIPEQHQANGLTIEYPPLGLSGRKVRIFSSETKPARAVVAVKYRGCWFYIDDTDMQTKLFYRLVRTLWSFSIAGSADRSAAPVLTIPVSR